MKKLLLPLLMLTTLATASEEVPTQEEVAKLYVATFNRAPDSAGLNYWINSGNRLSQIAQSFFDQPEAQVTYPSSTSNADFITSVYSNLFNRQPDTAGLNYWEGELYRGAFTKNSFIQAVINGARNTATSNDADILTNRTAVGLSFAEAGLNSDADARAIMIGVSDDTASMSSALSSFGLSLVSEEPEPIVIDSRFITYQNAYAVRMINIPNEDSCSASASASQSASSGIRVSYIFSGSSLSCADANLGSNCSGSGSCALGVFIN